MNNNTTKEVKTADELACEVGDYTDRVIISVGRPLKDGSVWVTTDDGREKFTHQDFKNYLNYDYIGNGQYVKA